MGATDVRSLEGSVRAVFGGGDPRAVRRGWAARLAALAIPALVGALFAHELRGDFGPLRLAAKCLLPFAVLVPLAVWLPRGRLRRGAGATFLAAAGGSAMVACFAVFGVPLDPAVLAELFRVAPPALLGPALAATAALGAAWRWLARGAPSALEGTTGALFAVTEGVYFGGFLLGATEGMGALALLAVVAGQALAATARGVPLARALPGAAVLVLAAFWAESAYAAIAVHLALLGSPALPGAPQLGVGRLRSA